MNFHFQWIMKHIMQVNPCFFVPMTLWKIDNPHKIFNDSAALSVYPHPYLYVQYHPYVLHWFHPYDLANPCVWIPGVRWSFPHTPCNVVYIEHNIVQSMLYFNIHVVMMYVLYTQTWITFVYSSNSFFPVFSPSSMGIPPSKLSISYTKLHSTIVYFQHFFPVSSPPSTRIPPSNCPVLKLLLWCMVKQI